MPHAAGAGGLPPLGLHGPVVLPDFSSGESAAGAFLLLDVERRLKHKFIRTSGRKSQGWGAGAGCFLGAVAA